MGGGVGHGVAMGAWKRNEGRGGGGTCNAAVPDRQGRVLLDLVLNKLLHGREDNLRVEANTTAEPKERSPHLPRGLWRRDGPRKGRGGEGEGEGEGEGRARGGEGE